MKNEPKYLKVFDKRTKLFGIKAEGASDWYIDPMFEEVELRPWSIYAGDGRVWFKRNGKYGLFNLLEKREEIPAVYSYPLHFNKHGFALTWMDHKAGVIDLSNNIRIPFIYDEIEYRFRRVPIPEEERPIRITEEGEEIHVGPTCKDVFYGYACFTNEGGVQAYDEECQPEQFHDWESDRLNLDHTPEYSNKEVERMSLESLEHLIVEEYRKLLELGYHSEDYWNLPDPKRESIDCQEEKVKSLISDRRRMMNQKWIHNEENAKRIGRTNKLLMRAVHKAIQLGRITAKSLQWMERVSNTGHYEVMVCVSPEWVDSKSDIRYERKFKSPLKESDRLLDDRNDVAKQHIWNIIATVGGNFHCDNRGACFHQYVFQYDPADWNETELIMDDGQTWDEGIRFPAYQDVYFTYPFHNLYENFGYSFEDLCNINDFKVNVEVHLETREQDKSYANIRTDSKTSD